MRDRELEVARGVGHASVSLAILVMALAAEGEGAARSNHDLTLICAGSGVSGSHKDVNSVDGRQAVDEGL